MIDLDVATEVNTAARTVGARTLAAGEARTVTLSRVYDTDIDDLWDACTNAERIPRWFAPVSGELKLGGHYQLEGNAGGTIETCDPPNSFTATWEYGGDVSWIELRLTDVDGGTRFTLEHIAHVDDERWNEFGPGAVGVGWDLGLVGLGLHVSMGGAFEYADGQAWMASENGVDFMRLASESWYRANVAAGTDEKAAREAADRTSAAYSGG